jgi:hypothetical protein
MRRSKIPYRSLDHTLKAMAVQIKDSLEFADRFLPQTTSVDEIWRILKDNLTYKHDPPGVELLQSFPSLMQDNYWGVPGSGDCDCFTIAAIACAVVRGFPARAVVVGNSKEAPSHIYAELWDGNKWVIFDLVNTTLGETKDYKFVQTIKVH